MSRAYYNNNNKTNSKKFNKKFIDIKIMNIKFSLFFFLYFLIGSGYYLLNILNWLNSRKYLLKNIIMLSKKNKILNFACVSWLDLSLKQKKKTTTRLTITFK